MCRSYFLRFSKKGDVYTNLTMPIFCASSNSITSLSFRCWSISVSEIREFNRKKKEKKKKKKMNNSKSGYCRFVTFPTLQIDPFFKPNLVFDGMGTMMLLEVQMNAH